MDTIHIRLNLYPDHFSHSETVTPNTGSRTRVSTRLVAVHSMAIGLHTTEHAHTDTDIQALSVQTHKHCTVTVFIIPPDASIYALTRSPAAITQQCLLEIQDVNATRGLGDIWLYVTCLFYLYLLFTVQFSDQ